jgi:hypothetical protein
MKYWEAEIEGIIFTAKTLRGLAEKLNIKPSLIEGAYYRSRLEDKIKIRKIVQVMKETKTEKIPDASGNFIVSFD